MATILPFKQRARTTTNDSVDGNGNDAVIVELRSFAQPPATLLLVAGDYEAMPEFIRRHPSFVG